MRNIMKDAVMGVVLGDALGLPVQFLSREQIKRRGKVDKMLGYGAFPVPAGSWSDDSSLSLATLASLNEKQDVDLKDIADRFVEWYYNGEYTPFGYSYDIGRACSEAISRYSKTRNPLGCGKKGEYANGNGALMRIMPACVFMYYKQKNEGLTDEQVINIIHAIASLTHNHLRSNMACGLYFFMTRSLIRNLENEDTKTLTECLQEGLCEGRAFYSAFEGNDGEIPTYHRLYDLEHFAKTPEKAIRSSGYVVDSIEAAVWSLITTDSIREALIKAVNLGEDTDSVAAIAGGLAGIFYGYDEMPLAWLREIQRREWIEAMCE